MIRNLPDEFVAEEFAVDEFAVEESAKDYGILAEIFSSFQGEGPFVGRRQIFVRTSGCNLNCSYCDTAKFRASTAQCRIEDAPGSGRFKTIENPVSPKKVIELILGLRTPGLHSVSITGGEPLCQPKFTKSLAIECSLAKVPVYLETNGFSSSRFARLIDWIDFASIDLKLPSHKSCPPHKWDDLFQNELACLKIASCAGVKTIAKAVILNSTKLDELDIAYPLLKELDATLVIQPATGPDCPALEKLAQFYSLASMSLEDVVVIPQVHKMMGIL